MKINNLFYLIFLISFLHLQEARSNDIESFCPEDHLALYNKLNGQASSQIYSECLRFIEKNYDANLIISLQNSTAIEINDSEHLLRGLYALFDLNSEEILREFGQKILDLAALGNQGFLIILWDPIFQENSNKTIEDSNYPFTEDEILLVKYELQSRIDEVPLTREACEDINRDNLRGDAIKIKYIFECLYTYEVLAEYSLIKELQEDLISIWGSTKVTNFMGEKDRVPLNYLQTSSFNVGSPEQDANVNLQAIRIFENKHGDLEKEVFNYLEGIEDAYTWHSTTLLEFVDVIDYKINAVTSLRRAQDSEFDILKALNEKVKSLLDNSNDERWRSILNTYYTFGNTNLGYFLLKNEQYEDSLRAYEKGFKLQETSDVIGIFDYMNASFAANKMGKVELAQSYGLKAVSEIEDWEKSYNELIEDDDISEVQKRLARYHPLDVAVVKSYFIYTLLKAGSISEAKDKYNSLVKEYSDKNRSLPSSITPQESLDFFINHTFKNFSLLNEHYNINDLEDPMGVYNLKFLLDESRYIESMAISSSNAELAKLQIEFGEI